MPSGYKASLNTQYSLAHNQIVVCFVVSMAFQNAARFESVNKYAMPAMPSDKNEAIRITESRFVGGDCTRHEQRQIILSSPFDDNKSL